MPNNITLKVMRNKEKNPSAYKINYLHNYMCILKATEQMWKQTVNEVTLAELNLVNELC